MISKYDFCCGRLGRIKICSFLLFVVAILFLVPGCGKNNSASASNLESAKSVSNLESSSKDYGVYIGATSDDLKDRNLPDIVVIDAQNLDSYDISELKEDGHIVYTYLNIGSVENYREYYSDYEEYTLDTYDNWEDEKWVDVSASAWQQFISSKADELLEMGVDGFFVDNCDVYYQYTTEEIYDGVNAILSNLHDKGAYVIINGGDVFVSEYLSRNGNLENILDGVNQESVYTSIDWTDNSFTLNDEDTREYFLDYLKEVMDAGKDAYAIEYADDSSVQKKAKELANTYGYAVYISDSLELN